MMSRFASMMLPVQRKPFIQYWTIAIDVYMIYSCIISFRSNILVFARLAFWSKNIHNLFRPFLSYFYELLMHDFLPDVWRQLTAKSMGLIWFHLLLIRQLWYTHPKMAGMVCYPKWICFNQFESGFIFFMLSLPCQEVHHFLVWCCNRIIASTILAW